MLSFSFQETQGFSLWAVIQMGVKSGHGSTFKSHTLQDHHGTRPSQAGQVARCQSESRSPGLRDHGWLSLGLKIIGQAQGWQTLSVKGQKVNICGLWATWSLWQLVDSASIIWMRPQTVPRNGRGCVPIDFIYKSRQQAQFLAHGPYFANCWPRA